METKKPLLVVFAGPNGSGKSTITDTFGNLKGYTNADEVVKNSDLTNKEAAEYVIGKRYSAIDKKEDFSFETVLSSDYNMNVIRKAISCIYMTIQGKHHGEFSESIKKNRSRYFPMNTGMRIVF